MRAAWLIVLVSCGGAASRTTYPDAKRDAGDDPYRWLEAMDSPATKAWVADENRLTDQHIAGLPIREAFRKRIAELEQRGRVSMPRHAGSSYFFTYQDGHHDLPTLQVSSSLDTPDRTLFDPNPVSENGKYAFIDYATSRDGLRAAYAMAEGGGDWQVWRTRDVASGKDLPDVLTGIKYYEPQLVASGVYYSRFPTPQPGKELSETDHDCKVYFHRWGTPVTSDAVVYERPDHPTWQFQLDASNDDQRIVISIGDGQVGDSNLEQIAVLSVATNKVTMLHDTFDADYRFIGTRGATSYWKTNADAQNYRIVSLDLDHPAGFVPIVAETKFALTSVGLAGSSLLVNELHDARSILLQYDLHGTKVRDVALPTVGTAYVTSGDATATEAYAFFSSFAYPVTVMRIDLASGTATPWNAGRPDDANLDPSKFETTQVFVTSKDGTKVPMFLTVKRGRAIDRSAVLLTGYGFGGISYPMVYQAPMIAWIERGGVFAVVNVRGGGEYGEAWQSGGKLSHQQNKLDDFNAAAAWLVERHASVGAIGTSGGGMLVASSVVQHPELYRAWFPIGGVLDLSRFHLFGQGAGWQADFGHPDVPEERAWLQAISPVHNVKPGTHYPAALVITSDHDVRVAPLHSYKFAAALQAAQAGSAPVLLRVDIDSGHGGGDAISQVVTQNAEIEAFAAKYLGL